MACERCPCPDVCEARPEWCAWAADPSLPRDSVQIRSICEVSRIRRAREAYPPLATMAGNALKAAGRIVAAVAKGDPIRVPPAVYRERLAICMGCEFNGARPHGVRCMKCGCTGLKLELTTERCPLDPPKWQATTS